MDLWSEDLLKLELDIAHVLLILVSYLQRYYSAATTTVYDLLLRRYIHIVKGKIWAEKKKCNDLAALST